MNLYLLDIIALLTLLLSALGTRLMIWVNITDIPVKRSSHTTPTPRAGGTAIVISFLSFMVIVDYFIFPLLTPYILVVLIASIAIALLGLIDDIKSLSYKTRLASQLCLAIIVTVISPKLENITIPGLLTFPLDPYAAFIITILWMVGIINVFNFMDGLNGLLSGCTMIALLFMMGILPLSHPLFYMCLGLGVAIAGFLRFNFHSGRIFLGDIGSQFLGFLIAILTLNTKLSFQENLNPFIVLLLFLPLLYDASFTILRRALKRRNVFTAHREHLYQLLNRSGWNHDNVSLLYFSYTGLSGLGALYLNHHQHDVNIYWIIPYIILYTFHTCWTLTNARLKGIKL